MNHLTYFKVTGIIFLAVAILHLWRAVNATPVAFGSVFVPVWVSWAGLVVAGYLAYQGLKRR